MSKQILYILKKINIKHILVLLIKVALLTIMLCWFTYDFVIVLPNIDFGVLLYILVMLVCLASLIGGIFFNNKKRYYIMFACAMFIYILMYNFLMPIIDSHGSDRCLDNGGVWDFEQHICRTDCWMWDDKLGCLKE